MKSADLTDLSNNYMQTDIKYLDVEYNENEDLSDV